MTEGEAGPELTPGGLGRPKTNSAPAVSAPETAESDDRPDETALSDLPTTEERVAQFIAEYPSIAGLPLSEVDGRNLRAEVTDETTIMRTVEPDKVDEMDHSARPFQVPETVERRSTSWAEAMRSFLDWYEEYRYHRLRFEKGKPYESLYEAFEISPENSWQPGYNRRQFAQLKALERQTVGFDTCAECASTFCRRPAEHETNRVEGEFKNPYTILLSRTASTTPDGEQAPPVEHDRQVSEAWQDGVYRTLRYVLEEKLGLDRESWVYWKQGEPHAGGGPASCYGHDHPCIIIDAPEGATEESIATAFEPVIDKHVDVCEWAGEEAHAYNDYNDPLKSSISVKEVGDGENQVRSVASYIAEYVQVDDDADLLERPIEYIAWGTVQWATNTQKAVRSNNANHAISADLCQQKYDDLDNQQRHEHGEKIVPSDRPGYNFECFECGSPWGIDQNHETLTEAKLSGGTAYRGDVQEAVAVAGPERPDRDVPVRGPEGLETDLKAMWSDARSVASNASGSVVGFDRPPDFKLTAMRDTRDDKEHGVSPGGIDMRPLKLPESRVTEWVAARRRDLVDRLESSGVVDDSIEVRFEGRFLVAEGTLPVGHPYRVRHGTATISLSRRMPEETADVPEVVGAVDVEHVDDGAGVREQVHRHIREELRKNETFTTSTVAGSILEEPGAVDRAISELVERGAVLDEGEQYRRA